MTDNIPCKMSQLCIPAHHSCGIKSLVTTAFQLFQFWLPVGMAFLLCCIKNQTVLSILKRVSHLKIVSLHIFCHNYIIKVDDSITVGVENVFYTEKMTDITY